MDNDKLANIVWKCFWGLIGLGLIGIIGIRGCEQYKYNQKLSNPDSVGVYVIKKGDNIWNAIVKPYCPDWMRQDDYLNQLKKINNYHNFNPDKVRPGDSIKFPIY